jgi:hypothetical protein
MEATVLNGQLELGNAVATQDEGRMVIGQLPIGSPTVTGGQLSVGNVDVGGIAYSSLGTNTTDIAGQWWITDILVPLNRVLTNISVMAGGTATTDNIMVAIWDAKGNLLASSAIAGQVLSGANTFQVVPLALNAAAAAATTLQLYGPQQYYVGVQGNGTAAGAIQTIPASSWNNVCCGSVAGTFGTVPKTITLPATFTAAKGPIVALT